MGWSMAKQKTWSSSGRGPRRKTKVLKNSEWDGLNEKEEGEIIVIELGIIIG